MPKPTACGRYLLAAALLTPAGTAPTFAQTPDEPTLPAAPEQRQAEPGSETPQAEGDGFFERANLLGDPGGVRGRLEARGITLTLSEDSVRQRGGNCGWN